MVVSKSTWFIIYLKTKKSSKSEIIQGNFFGIFVDLVVIGTDFIFDYFFALPYNLYAANLNLFVPAPHFDIKTHIKMLMNMIMRFEEQIFQCNSIASALKSVLEINFVSDNVRLQVELQYEQSSRDRARLHRVLAILKHDLEIVKAREVVDKAGYYMRVLPWAVGGLIVVPIALIYFGPAVIAIIAA
jgi:hypothetical protein